MLDFLSNLFGSGVNYKIAQENRASQEAFNAQQLAFGREQMAQQKEFAQMGLRWKVQDAVAAGLHPLIGAGSQAQSFSPVSVGGSAPQLEGNLGQDVSRAIKAAGSMFGREKQDEEEARKITIEKGHFENDILRAELASKVNRTSRAAGQIGPPLTLPGDRVPIPRPGPARSAGGFALQEDDLKQKPDDAPERATVRPFGYPLTPNPYFGDGQSFEDRYGDSEIGSTLKFGVNTLADHFYTGYKFIEPHARRAGRAYRRYQTGVPSGTLP